MVRLRNMGATGAFGHSIYVAETARRLRENPKDLDALFASAALMAATQRYDRALQLLDALGRLDEGYPGLWRFKARVYRETGDPRNEKLCLAAAERAEAVRR